MQRGPIRNRFLKSVLAVAIAGGLSVSASGQDLNIQNNAFSATVASASYSSGNKSVLSSGLIEPISGIPTPGGLTIPAFSFALEQSGVADGDYVFTAGVVVDDDNSDRRLEMQLPSLKLTFTGGVMTGSVEALQTIKVLGRSADGSLDVSGDYIDSDGSTAIDGATVSFNAAKILADIEGDAGNAATVILADIIDTISAAESGHYTYGIFIKQTSSTTPDTLRFGTTNGSSFTPFPRIQTTCTLNPNSQTTSQFLVNSNELAATFDMAYGVQGQLSFAGASSVAGPAPAAFTEVCESSTTPTDPDPDPDEVPVEEQADEVDDFIDAITFPAEGEEIPQSLEDEINLALDATEALATNTADGVASGDLTSSEALDAVDTLSSGIELAVTSTDAGAEIDVESVSGIVGGIADTFEALDDAGALSSVQLDGVAATTETTIMQITSLVGGDAALEDNELLIDETSNLLQSAQSLGVAIDSSLTDSAQALSQTTIESNLDDIASSLGIEGVEFVDEDTTRDLLTANPTLLSEVLEVTAVSITSTLEIDEASAVSEYISEGVTATSANSLIDDLTQFLDPNGVTVEVGTETVSATDVISDAFGSGTVTVDSTTNQVEIVNSTGTIQGFVTDVSIVPPSIPEGNFTEPDGSIISISNGIAVTITPSPQDSVEFVSAIDSVGGGDFTTDISDSGIVSLTDTVSGDVFSATFTFDPIGNTTPSGDTEFTVPTGDPASPDYVFTVEFSDGSVQDIVPAVSDTSFFESVSSYGFEIETDRSTGLVHIEEFSFRPDYFLTALSASESAFLTANIGPNGVAYLPMDANGDGITDYKVLTAGGGQIVYGQP